MQGDVCNGYYEMEKVHKLDLISWARVCKNRFYIMQLPRYASHYIIADTSQ